MAADRRLGLGTMAAYGFGQVGEAVKNVGFNTFLLFFYNQVIGVSATITSVALGSRRSSFCWKRTGRMRSRGVSAYPPGPKLRSPPVTRTPRPDSTAAANRSIAAGAKAAAGTLATTAWSTPAHDVSAVSASASTRVIRAAAQNSGGRKSTEEGESRD